MCQSWIKIEQGAASTSGKAGKAAALELHQQPAAAKKPPKAPKLCERQRQRSRCKDCGDSSICALAMPSLPVQSSDFRMRDQRKSSSGSAGAGAVRGHGVAAGKMADKKRERLEKLGFVWCGQAAQRIRGQAEGTTVR